MRVRLCIFIRRVQTPRPKVALAPRHEKHEPETTRVQSHTQQCWPNLEEDTPWKHMECPVFVNVAFCNHSRKPLISVLCGKQHKGGITRQKNQITYLNCVVFSYQCCMTSHSTFHQSPDAHRRESKKARNKCATVRTSAPQWSKCGFSLVIKITLHMLVLV